MRQIPRTCEEHPGQRNPQGNGNVLAPLTVCPKEVEDEENTNQKCKPRRHLRLWMLQFRTSFREIVDENELWGLGLE